MDKYSTVTWCPKVALCPHLVSWLSAHWFKICVTQGTWYHGKTVHCSIWIPLISLTVWLICFSSFTVKFIKSRTAVCISSIAGVSGTCSSTTCGYKQITHELIIYEYFWFLITGMPINRCQVKSISVIPELVFTWFRAHFQLSTWSSHECKQQCLLLI